MPVAGVQVPVLATNIVGPQLHLVANMISGVLLVLAWKVIKNVFRVIFEAQNLTGLTLTVFFKRKFGGQKSFLWSH